MYLHPLSITMAGAAFPVSITLRHQWCKYSVVHNDSRSQIGVAWTKQEISCRRYIQMHFFLNEKDCILIRRLYLLV